MTILQLLPELKVGGVERGTVEVAKELVKCGHRAIVVSNGGRLVQELEASGVRHVCMPVHQKSPWKLLKQVKPLVALIEEEGVDVIHARSRMPAIVGWLAARQARVPFITTAHGLYSRHPLSRVMGWGKFVIVPSETIGRHMRDAFAVPHERLRLIPRGVDVATFRPKHRIVLDGAQEGELGSWADDHEPTHDASRTTLHEYKIALVGRMASSKGHLDAVKAMVTVVSRYPNAKLLLIGDVPQGRSLYRDRLQELMRTMQLEENVQLLGGRHDVETLLADCDVALVPSRRAEAFGRGIIEAWACRIPVIATRVGGLVDVVTDGASGLLVPPGRPDALAGAIMSLLDDPALRRRLADAGHALVRERYTLRHMVQATIKVYSEAVECPRILVIKLSALGDVLLSVPTFRALREAYPRGELMALTTPAFAPLLLRSPYVDNVLTYDRYGRDQGVAGRWRIGTLLRRRAFDIVIDLQNNRSSRWLSVMSAAPVRVGFARGWLRRVLTHQVPVSRPPAPPVQQQERLLDEIGVEMRNRELEFWVRPEETRYVDQLLAQGWASDDAPLVGVHIGSSPRWKTKRWDLDRFAAVCDALSQRGVRVALLGGPSDVPDAQAVVSQVSSPLINAVGGTTLGELAALMQRCDAVLVPDSAPLHLAAAVEVPTVALFGPTEAGRHLPVSEHIRVLSKQLPCRPCYRPTCEHRSCLRQIRVEEVLAALYDIIGEPLPRADVPVMGSASAG